MREIFFEFEGFGTTASSRCVIACADAEGWTAGPDPLPLINDKAIGFPSNSDSDLLKNHIATTSQHSMLSHHRPASETSFKWRFAGGPMMTRF